MNMDIENLGKTIKSQRLQRHISQAKLSKLLDMKQALLSEWETGKKTIPQYKIKLIEDIFKKLDTLSDAEIESYVKRRKYKQIRYDVATGQPLSNIKKHLMNAVSKKLLRQQLKSNRTTLSDKPKGIALFAGCGGLSRGFHQAGFDVVGFAELEHNFHVTYKKNFPNSLLLGDDVRNITNDDVKDWKVAFGEIDVLFGGPPCQGFSLAGKRDVFDPRNELYLEFVRIASVLKPKTILLENVRLLTSMKTVNGNYASEDIVDRFEKIGYTMSFQIVNAKDYGVPQSRERVIFIGVRKDLDIDHVVFPEKTHGPANELTLFPSLKPYVTFRDATRDLERLESGEASKKDRLHFAITHPDHVIKWLKITPEGESAHNNADPDMRPKSGYNTTYKRIRWDEPSSTIGTTFSMISGSRNVHPQDTRAFTIREAARCQTFPDSFLWEGRWGTIRTMIGNAVPPLLAEVMAKHIMKSYIKKEAKPSSVQPQATYKNIQLPS
jgi:DNA (cytosine-5)-methyltransferase 1